MHMDEKLFKVTDPTTGDNDVYLQNGDGVDPSKTRSQQLKSR